MTLVTSIKVVPGIQGSNHAFFKEKCQHRSILNRNRLAADIPGKTAHLLNSVAGDELNQIQPMNPQPDQEPSSRFFLGGKPGTLVFRLGQPRLVSDQVEVGSIQCAEESRMHEVFCLLYWRRNSVG